MDEGVGKDSVSDVEMKMLTSTRRAAKKSTGVQVEKVKENGDEGLQEI